MRDERRLARSPSSVILRVEVLLLPSLSREALVLAAFNARVFLISRLWLRKAASDNVGDIFFEALLCWAYRRQRSLLALLCAQDSHR